MFVFGHLGIGRAIASPWLNHLPLAPFFLGALLPDLIDKPLYYARVAATGRHGAELGLLAGTRTIGHMMLLTLLVAGLGWARGSKPLLAVALGMATHQLLDTVSDLLGSAMGLATDPTGIPGYAAVVWPLLGTQFPIAPFSSVAGHAQRTLVNPVTMGGEVVGAVLLLAWFRRRRVTAR
jgi:hypothetical protein